MTRGEYVTVVLALWVGAGLATALWMGRRGHRDPLWLFFAVVFGPVLAVMAPERIERSPRLVSAEPPQESADGVTVLVGVDGSPESDAALRAVLDLLPGRLGRLIAAEVVDYDAADSDDWRGRQAAARAHFTDTHIVCGPRNVECEVLAGPPAQALLRCAREQDVDLIAVGRRGRGLSVRLLGSVADELTRTAPVPVLVVGAHAATEQPQAETTATVSG
ncbi:universal stress protein [Salinispora arenicola]|uniref:universal stress protein n=1 Tax=Salinispora arenicola TaxID=168697 RepID=UPI0003729C74|nr:universal stress protein [Salinispora arenicola]